MGTVSECDCSYDDDDDDDDEEEDRTINARN